jgi:hypothetical protein
MSAPTIITIAASHRRGYPPAAADGPVPADSPVAADGPVPVDRPVPVGRPAAPI